MLTPCIVGKVGVEFGSVVQLGDSLLDITQQINKEQTLSTILNEQISLQRLAAANAADDSIAAQQALADIAEKIFTQTSGVQRRLAAEALGVPLAELQRLRGLRRGGMPMATGGGGNAELAELQKQTRIAEENRKFNKRTSEKI